ncbi:MAG: hypothetical protein FJ118_01245 [Deltaproteobacteria bacterium]|nr:hypothetical protein [Deltaproteobacteria bacterium]
MIDGMQAARKAVEYLQRFSTDMRMSGPIARTRLEEVDLSEDEKYWLITLGWDEDDLGIRRVYKVFKVDSETGKVVSMRMREPA